MADTLTQIVRYLEMKQIEVYAVVQQVLQPQKTSCWSWPTKTTYVHLSIQRGAEASRVTG